MEFNVDRPRLRRESITNIGKNPQLYEPIRSGLQCFAIQRLASLQARSIRDGRRRKASRTGRLHGTDAARYLRGRRLSARRETKSQADDDKASETQGPRRMTSKTLV